MPDEQVYDSPIDWVARHVRTYVESGGRKGHHKWGAPTLLLTTRGRKTGKLRRTALIYGRDGDRYVVVGSNGGARTNPDWYFNLREHPDVTVQVEGEVFAARARPADPEERPRLWRIMTQIWPTYETYQARLKREIPVVVLERH
ncbi:MAG TPA: nitroreductase family deazaflavin-dependent oxidoreductase [Jiangellaceae bacterium]